ncbi:hypothetical protein AC579_2960 [Pseudocercospora musae]|uniref:Uncharacterized protein n=1 Tax=Pseudocercospora musae TaxID=113226 RepID=A0A139I6H3_9PEZI|nr:hypothetical protein AC579_2960 [Pseudocercospora musae]KXT10242.1 hypothetical protein AC579_2960 [Pseudocercospora musae]
MRFLSLILPTAVAIASHSLAVNSPQALHGAFSKDPMKLMIVGDSITHGHEGDFTWRYRLWEWMTSTHVSFAFVGPYTGTTAREAPLAPGQSTSAQTDINDYPRIEWGYAANASTNFESHHFATSGYKAELARDDIGAQVKAHDPDVLLIMLGYNDLAWGCKQWTEAPFACTVYVNAHDLIPIMKTLIDNARVAKPNLRFAISNIIERSIFRQDIHENTVVYNELFRDAIQSWSTEKSPIFHVDVATKYACGPYRPCPAAFDGLHPNALGEYQIASAFSETLVQGFGIGNGQLGIPNTVPERAMPPPVVLRAVGNVAGATLTWHRIYGITGYEVASRTEGQDWTTHMLTSNRSDILGLAEGIKVDFRLRSCYGQCGEWSDTVSTITGTTRAEDSFTSAEHIGGPTSQWHYFTSTDRLLGIIYLSLLGGVFYVLWRSATRRDVKALLASSKSWLETHPS